MKSLFRTPSLFCSAARAQKESEYKGNKSANQTKVSLAFTESFTKKVIQWFSKGNCCQISPTTTELLFGIIPNSKETKLIHKFNYTTLAMRHYIYSNKINSKAIYMHEFINKLSLKYSLENIN